MPHDRKQCAKIITKQPKIGITFERVVSKEELLEKG